MGNEVDKEAWVSRSWPDQKRRPCRLRHRWVRRWLRLCTIDSKCPATNEGGDVRLAPATKAEHCAISAHLRKIARGRSRDKSSAYYSVQFFFVAIVDQDLTAQTLTAYLLAAERNPNETHGTVFCDEAEIPRRGVQGKIRSRLPWAGGRADWRRPRQSRDRRRCTTLEKGSLRFVSTTVAMTTIKVNFEMFTFAYSSQTLEYNVPGGAWFERNRYNTV